VSVGPPDVVVHADEACLGNGREGRNPGGAGGLVEAVRRGAPGRRGTGAPTARRDYWISEPDTTNNRMAIRSAIAALELIGARGKRPAILFVSDSEYLVKGMNEYLRAWVRRGWKNVKNPELWQELAERAEEFVITWRWVRGHARHVRNEYADFLATRAAKQQTASGGLVESGFTAWLAGQQEKRRYVGYDADAELRDQIEGG
jgi:ribonuclease HI